MGSSFNLFRNYSDLWDPPEVDAVSLTEEQKRKKQEEETFKNLPWYMKYDKQIEEGILGTEKDPTAAGQLFKGAVKTPLDIIHQGLNKATSAIAGVPEQEYRKTLEGAFAPTDQDPSMYSPEDLTVDIPSPPRQEKESLAESTNKYIAPVMKELAFKGIEASSDPTQLAFLAGGPIGATAGALLAPGMIQGGAERAGTGISDIESGNVSKGLANIASGAVDVGMGGFGLKHPIEAGGEVLGEAFPEQLEQPINTEDYFSVGLPSGERGALDLGSEGLKKLNVFEDSQYRKYGADWRAKQSNPERIYHESLIKKRDLATSGTPDPIVSTPTLESSPAEPSTPELQPEALPVEKLNLPIEAPPEVSAPKGVTREDLAKVIDPDTAQRVLDLVNQGHDLDRATKIARAESIEELEGPEALNADDLDALMSMDVTSYNPYELKQNPETLKSLDVGRPEVTPIKSEPPPTVESIPEEAPQEPLRTFKVKLSNGEIYGIKARGAEDAIERVNKRIEEYGVDVKAVEAKERPTRLEQLIQSPSPSREAEMLKTSKTIEAAKTAEELAAAKAQRKDEATAIKEQKAQEAEDIRRMQRAYNLKRDMIKVQVREKAKMERNLKPKGLERPEILESDNLRETWAKMTPSERLRAPFDLLKSLRAAIDTPVLRQGKNFTYDMIFNNPKALWESLKTMKNQAFSENEFKSVQEGMMKDPNIKAGVEKFGLDLPGVGKALKEEAFHGGITEKIPVIKHIVRPSDRAYTSFLNAARAWKFNDITSKLKEAGYDINNPDHAKAFEEAAKAVNIAGARGHFSNKTASVLNNLSSLLWSPRNRAAKGQLLLEYGKARTGLGEQMNPVVSRELVKGFERTAAVNLSLLGLAALSGSAVVSLDPDNTDFLRAKIGNTVWDPWFGLQPMVRDVARAATGRRVSSAGKERKTSVSEQVGDYLTSGLAPGPSLLIEQVTGKTAAGFEKDRFRSAVESVTPMVISNLYDQLEAAGVFNGSMNGEQAAGSIASFPLQFMGESIDTRGTGTKKVGKYKGSSGGSHEYAN